jgi:hypothetical protein
VLHFHAKGDVRRTLKFTIAQLKEILLSRSIIQTDDKIIQNDLVENPNANLDRKEWRSAILRAMDFAQHT